MNNTDHPAPRQALPTDPHKLAAEARLAAFAVFPHPVAVALTETIDHAAADHALDHPVVIGLCRTILALHPAGRVDPDALVDAARAYSLAHARHRLHHLPGDSGSTLWAEVAALHRTLGCTAVGDYGTRVLTGTVIRVLSCELTPLEPLDGDPYRAWVVISAWQTRRALLVPGTPFLAASPADTHYGLAGQRFIGDVWEPDGLARPCEHIRIDTLRYAEPPDLGN